VLRPGPTEPHHLTGFDPPAPGEDPELDRVAAEILTKDPDGRIMGDVLRETYDQLYDGQRTGRWSPGQLRKTEKTHMGTLVEINVHRAFDFEDGVAMDYRISGVEVDCKFAARLGGWMLPREAYTQAHLCLVIWASEESNRWEAGVVRAKDDPVLLGAENQDRKRPLTPHGESTIRWLYASPSLPENLLFHIDDVTRDRIFDPTPERGREPSGQAKVNMLFELVQQRVVNRASVLTVAQQKDSMKRARDARKRKHLGSKGILVLGRQDGEERAAADLGLPVPTKGSFISARVVRADARFKGPSAEISGSRWRLATNLDPVTAAPVMPKPSRRTSDDE